MKTIAKRRNITCYCDFCGSSDDEVFKMVEGVGAFICNNCVETAQMIVIRAKEAAGLGRDRGLVAIISA